MKQERGLTPGQVAQNDQTLARANKLISRLVTEHLLHKRRCQTPHCAGPVIPTLERKRETQELEWGPLATILWVAIDLLARKWEASNGEVTTILDEMAAELADLDGADCEQDEAAEPGEA